MDRLVYLQNFLEKDLSKESPEIRQQAASHLRGSRLANDKKNKPTILSLIEEIIRKLNVGIGV
jgi:hypothetical protein